MTAHIPAGTPYMPNPEVVTTGEGIPGLCSSCGHATLIKITSTVLHDDGALALEPETVCVSDECSPEE